MSKLTTENTAPSQTDYNDISYLEVIVEAGKKFQEAQAAIANTNSPHSGAMWLGPCPVIYLDEVVGYFVEEGDYVNFHRPELVDQEGTDK